MTDKFALYYAAFEALKPQMRAFVEAVVAPFPGGMGTDEDNGDDYGFMSGVRQGEDTIAVTIYLRDSDENPPGKRGNLIAEIVGFNGIVRAVYSPMNYTPECWVRYGADLDVLKLRMSQIMECVPDAQETIRKVLEDSKPHFVECGCCGHFHRPEYRGDCRADSERYTAELLDQRHGEDGWTYDSVEDQMEAEKAEGES